jgi:hypothetical protein
MVDITNNAENDNGFGEWHQQQRIALNVVNLAMSEFLEKCRTYGIDPESVCTVLAAVKFEMSRDMSKEEKDLYDDYGEQLAMRMRRELEEHDRAQAVRDAMREGFATVQVLPLFQRR